MKNNLLKSTTTLFLLITLFAACSKTNIKLNKTELSMNVGDVETLTVTTRNHLQFETLEWTTSNSEVADIKVIYDFDGERCIVTAKSEGTAVITVATEDGRSTAKCAITVTLQAIEPEMVFVEGGTFWMGCTGEQGDDCYNFEEPAHQVTLSDYYIGKYVITQKQWKAIMGTSPSYFDGDNLPVEHISWYDAQEFITKLNEITGKNYRFPTEAEWEYAARGGQKSRNYKYCGSNNLDEVAWYKYNEEDGTRPVGTKLPNELGIYDMSGNAFEWCLDWYATYQEYPQTNPTGSFGGDRKVVRGGYWNSNAKECRVSFRLATNPYSNIGYAISLRLCLDGE